MMKDVTDERTQLTGVVESMENMLADRDREVDSLKTEASINDSI